MSESASRLTSPSADSPDIVARAGRYYRNARYIFCLICLAYGIWSIYHGFYLWPAENAHAQATAQRIPHPGYAVPLNRTLGFVLPIIAVALLAWTLYNSRGEIRLSDNILYVPGHPPISFDSIVRIDKRQWETKGIAIIDYRCMGVFTHPSPGTTQTVQFKLDDFVYQRHPIDSILSRIEAHVAKNSA